MPTRRITVAELIEPATEQLAITLDALMGKLVVLGMLRWSARERTGREVAEEIITHLHGDDPSDVAWAWAAVDVGTRAAQPPGPVISRQDPAWWATALGRVVAASWARRPWEEPLSIEEAGAILGLVRSRVHQLLSEGILLRPAGHPSAVDGSSVARRLLDVGVAVHRRPASADEGLDWPRQR